jgi:KDO2-lipid IV(A) lauroyltransferase
MARRKPRDEDAPPTLRDRLAYGILATLLAGLLLLPYRTRVRLGGWLSARVGAPIFRIPALIRQNLARSLPDLSEHEIGRLVHEVSDNTGRTMVELASGRDFLAQAAKARVTGVGLDAVLAAHAAGRPVILVSGHFGSYDVPRAHLASRGIQVGGIYQPPLNPLIHDRYRRLISVFGSPVFPRGRRGTGGLVKHLKSGGMAGMLVDWHLKQGAELRFFGRPALTALSAAELALKYDCLVVPVYGLRREDGLSFDLVVEHPIPHTTPEAMTQALNDSLEAMVRRHPGQWFWGQRRWKSDDQRLAREAAG